MKISKKFVLLLFAILVGFSYPAMAERVILKSGESFDGTIIERNDQFITIQTGGAPVYLSLDRVAQIIENDAPAPQSVREPSPAKPAAVLNASQISEIPNASRQDGSFYYQQAKTDLQAGKFDNSMKNLYTAVSLGVNDSEGLKDKIEFARKAVEQVKAKKNDIQKMADQLDPKMLASLLRLGTIIGIIVVLLLLIALYKRLTAESDLSHFVVSRSGGDFLRTAENVFTLRAGPNKRVCAFLLDVLIIIFPSLVLIAVFGPAIGVSAMLVYVFLKDCIGGQSPGKKILGLQIIDTNNQPAAPNSIVLRNFYWFFVVVLPLFHPYLAMVSIALIVWEYWGMLSDAQGQRLGDKISSTRVLDLKPRFDDWKYIIVSLVVIIGMGGLYRLSVLGMAEFLNQSELANTERDYHDGQGRFSFQIPAGFVTDPQYDEGNTLVFNHRSGRQLFSVFVMDLNQEQAFLSDQLEMAAASFLSAKLKIDAQQIINSAALTKTEIAGKPVAMYSYNSNGGKSVSVCLIHAQRFYEINFFFKDGVADQTLITAFVNHFRFLDAAHS